jgi:hypothetical protein
MKINASELIELHAAFEIDDARASGDMDWEWENYSLALREEEAQGTLRTNKMGYRYVVYDPNRSMSPPRRNIEIGEYMDYGTEHKFRLWCRGRQLTSTLPVEPLINVVRSAAERSALMGKEGKS